MAFSDILTAVSIEQLVVVLLGTWILCAGGVGLSRLWFSPISHIPGPRLAAMTLLYEFYYDIVLGGQYTFKIIEMHKKYGPVVRINPWEVHVGVHDFHSELYTGPTRPRNKTVFYTKQFGAPHSALATIDHHHHKLRRSALNPFFSMQTVRSLQPVIEERVDTLLHAFLKYGSSQNQQPLNIMYPFSAFTNDVINEYAFARCDHLIETDDFGKEVVDNLLTGTHMGPVVKHANWLLEIVNGLPEKLSGQWVPGWGGFLKMKKDIVDQISDIKASEHTDKWQLDVSHPTIFHEILSSDLLPSIEKSPIRLAQEGQILVQGGTLTSSWTISVAVFHLLNRPSALRKLRDELFVAIPKPDDIIPLVELEQLPYLRAVVKEAIRHGLGTGSRLARIPTDENLICTDPDTGRRLEIPSGTHVSMSPYKTLMDEVLFPEPTVFEPERWLGDGELRLDKYLQVAFGGGSRNCLGMALAQSEMHLMLAKLWRQWGSGGIHGVPGSKGDKREGDTGCLKIYQTTDKDAQMAADYFIPIPFKGSRGLRCLLEAY